MRVESGFAWPPTDSGLVSAVFLTLPDLQKALTHVTDFSVCVQAGGATGVWPKYLSKRFNSVYTFEPDKENFWCLCYNVPEANVFKFPCALGNGGTGAFEVNPINKGAGQLKPGWGDTPILRIDALHLTSCGFIQLDVEGMELDALKGATGTIKKYKPILMIEDKGLGEPPFNLLRELGYEVIEQLNRDYILKCAT